MRARGIPWLMGSRRRRGLAGPQQLRRGLHCWAPPPPKPHAAARTAPRTVMPRKPARAKACPSSQRRRSRPRIAAPHRATLSLRPGPSESGGQRPPAVGKLQGPLVAGLLRPLLADVAGDQEARPINLRGARGRLRPQRLLGRQRLHRQDSEVMPRAQRRSPVAHPRLTAVERAPVGQRRRADPGGELGGVAPESCSVGRLVARGEAALDSFWRHHNRRVLQQTHLPIGGRIEALLQPRRFKVGFVPTCSRTMARDSPNCRRAAPLKPPASRKVSSGVASVGSGGGASKSEHATVADRHSSRHYREAALRVGRQVEPLQALELLQELLHGAPSCVSKRCGQRAPLEVENLKQGGWRRCLAARPKVAPPQNSEGPNAPRKNPTTPQASSQTSFLFLLLPRPL